jgi:hypothetical protein
MILLFLFILPFALWWAILWLALPVDWDALTLPKLVLLHLVPPLLSILAWVLTRRLWTWRTNKRKRRATEMEAAAKQQTLATNRATHERLLAERRAHVECRGVWAFLPKVPDWAEELPETCSFLDAGQGGTPDELLRHALETVLLVNEALAWLPVRVLYEESFPKAISPNSVNEALRQIVETFPTKNDAKSHTHNILPPKPTCDRLPGKGDIADRVLKLFEQDPHLPALLLMGLGEQPVEAEAEVEVEVEVDNFPSEDAASDSSPNTVLMMLFARPGLRATSGETPPPPPPPSDDEKGLDVAPYWERPVEQVDASGVWGKVPIALQPDFLAKLPPLAALPRSRLVARAERPALFKLQIQQAFHEAFIDAEMRDLPFKEKKDEQAGAQDKPEDAPAEPPVAPEIGWCVHNTPDSDRLGQIIAALHESGSDLEIVADGTKLSADDTTTAHDAWMQVLALSRAVQQQKPVLLAGTYDYDEGGTRIAFVRPCTQNQA